MSVLVTGATGTVGRHLVTQLAEAGQDVRALTRAPDAAHLPDGVTVVAGDLTHPASLTDALEGVVAVHLLTFGGDDAEPLTTGPELVRLATRAGVRRVTVLGGWDESSVEPALRGSDLAWTLLHPVEFASGALEWAGSIREHGVVRQLADWPSAVVHEADIAAVALTALTEDGHGGQTYPVTGPQALTPAERTHLIGEAIGRDVRFERLTEDEERERLRSYGYPPDHVEFGIQLATAPPPAAAVVHGTVERVTGRPARPFAQWARENADSFRDV